MPPAAPQSPAEYEQLLRRAYEAFNARDVDAVIALMHPDVDWPNGFEGGREHGHAAVREYWARQFRQIDSRVEPQRFDFDDEGRVIVDVRQTGRDDAGNLLYDEQVRHVYTFKDGLIERMDISEA